MEADFRDSRLTTQAWRMESGLMVSDAPAHVELEIALYAFKVGVQGMPGFPGQLGYNINFGDVGLLGNDGSNV